MLDRMSTNSAEGAFERLYLEHHRAVLGYCARRASRADAWDATAEVFLVAWRRFEDVPPDDEARAWLIGVAYRVLANQRRGSARRKRLFERMAGVADRPPWPEDQLIRGEAAREVIDALAMLKPADREILQLAAWEELSPIEITEVLGISRQAVDQRYSRAKRRLARELERARSQDRRATQANSESGGVA
jgi:RNA polymerase sigma-70 factor, ECF subfamily